MKKRTNKQFISRGERINKQRNKQTNIHTNKWMNELNQTIKLEQPNELNEWKDRIYAQHLMTFFWCLNCCSV